MDLKQQVPENCFPTDQEGNRTEESKHKQQVLGSWWLQPLPMQSKAGPEVYEAQACPGRLAHVLWDFMGLSPQGSFSALATFHKDVSQECQISLSQASNRRAQPNPGAARRGELWELCPDITC